MSQFISQRGAEFDKTVLYLRGQKLTVGQIGQKLHVSKNVIAGILHRMKRNEEGVAPTQQAQKPRVPRPKNGPSVERVADTGCVPAEKVAENMHQAPVRDPAAGECCWPIGNPGKPSFSYCGDPARRGRPYCEAHSSVAYISQRTKLVSAREHHT
jgi:GcrA cell cycle regulator